MGSVAAIALGGPEAPLPGLSESELRVLSYASAMGKEFDFAVLQIVSEMEEERLAEVLEGLVHRGVLRELQGGDSYAFLREDTQEQLYRTISSSRVRVIHKKIAEANDRAYAGDPPPGAIAEMGRHYHLGRVAEKSVMYNRYAATLARGSFSPETAVRYLERVLEDLKAMSGDHGSELADVYREIGDLHMSTGEAARADEMYLRALESNPQAPAVTRALLLLSRAEANRAMARLPVLRQCAETALSLFEASGHPRGLATAHRLLSRAAFTAGEYEVGRKEVEAAIALLSSGEDAKEIARCYIDLGNAYSDRSDPEGQELSERSYRKAITSLTELQDFKELSRAHNNLAIAIGPRDPRAALVELDQAMACAERIHYRHSVGWALFNSVEFLLAVGQEAEAAAANEEAFAILSRMDDPIAMQQITLNRGILAQKRKVYPEAERAFTDTLKSAIAIGPPNLVSETKLRLGLLYVEWGRREDALRELTEVEALGRGLILPWVRPLYEDLKQRLATPVGGPSVTS